MREPFAHRGSIRRAIAVVAVLGLTTGAAACGGDGDSKSNSATNGSPASTGAERDASAGPDQEITLALESEPESLDPNKIDTPSSLAMTWSVYESLYDIVGGELVETLAEGEPRKVDDTTWEVTLGDGHKFADGSPVTADDVVFSYERIIDPEYATGFNEIENIKGAKKIDDRTVQISTVVPDPVLQRRLTAVKIVKDGTKDFDTSNGSGPYKITSFNGNSALIEFNESYPGDKPQVTKVNVKVIPDPASRIAALKTGEVDIIEEISPDDFAQAPKVVASPTDEISTFIRLNQTKPPFDDVRARIAANHAIDVKSVTDKLFDNSKFATPLECQPAPSNVESFSTAVKQYPYDPAKAKALIEEAGLTGTPVTLNWVTGGAEPLDSQVGQIFAQQLETNTGLKVDLKLLDFNTWVESIRTPGKEGAEAALVGLSNPMQSIVRNTALVYPSDGPFSSMKDPEMDRLMKTAVAAFPPDRQPAWDAALKYACDKAVLVNLYSYKSIFGVNKKIGLSWESVVRPRFDQVSVSTAG